MDQVDLPVLGAKDEHDILNFGIPQGVDYIAASFVQSGSDVRSFAVLLSCSLTGTASIDKGASQTPPNKSGDDDLLVPPTDPLFSVR